MSRHRKLAAFVLLASTALAFAMGDLGLRGLHNAKGWRWQAYTRLIYESWLSYYNYGKKVEGPPAFDRILGWRRLIPRESRPEARCTFNRENWRSTHEYEREKSVPRIALLGDSYVNYCLHDDDDLVSAHLQSLAGPQVEVLNFGAPAFGLDQISLAATEVAVDYAPNVYVLAFIEDDLERSCGALIPAAMKPRFELESGVLKLEGVPVRTAEEILAARQGWATRAFDALAVWTAKSYTARLLGEIAFERRMKKCLVPLNTAILKRVRERLPPPAKLVFAFLDGDPLPAEFVHQVKSIPDAYVDVPPLVPELAKKLGVTPGHFPDGHADAALNRIYAEAIWWTVEPWLVGPSEARRGSPYSAPWDPSSAVHSPRASTR